MQVIHVEAVTDDLPALLSDRLDERGIAQRDRCVYRRARADAVLLERLHHAEDAHAIAVTPQRVVAQVRIRGLQRAERLEGLALLVERKPLQRNRDPQRDAG